MTVLNEFKLNISTMKTTDEEYSELLRLLLLDRTTRKNIIWATDSYIEHGKGFSPHEHITKKHIKEGYIIPRSHKNLVEQKERTKDKAEVMTPSFIIKQMVEAVDDELQEMPLYRYVCQKWLEITAGEAPYIVNRIDTVSGEHIEIEDRVGFLDKKLQRISKEINDHDTWVWLALRAYKASYGYEYQGDSLYLARVNLLYSFIDYYKDKFNEEPANKYILEVVRIIGYNLIQMDGLKNIIPLSDEEPVTSPNVCEMDSGLIKVEATEPIVVKSMNWLTKTLFTFKEISEKEGGNKMKFDVVIGNPPYQEDRAGTRAKQIYPQFMDSSYEIADIVILITPGRFLFNAGGTSKKWNERMLNDVHLKVVDYEPIGQVVFPSTDIKGGVAITYRDTAESFEPIDFFVPNKTMKEILVKVESHKPMETLDSIFYSQSSYKITRTLIDDFKDHKEVYKRSERATVKTNLFDKLDYIFLEDEPFENEEYIMMLGRAKNRRVYRWVKREYIDTPNNFKDWKVMLPKANGSGHFGEALSSPEIGRPFVGHTETFVSFGSFRNEVEALACLKYIKSKFARSLLGTLKITQDNTKRVWAKIPLQDFTSDSDIDWSKSIPDIDQQLYKKYGLNEEEINFIETHVKEMD